MTNKDWTDLLREKMEAHEAPVPDGLWEEIESNLPESPAAKSSFWTPIRRYAAAAAITALLIGGAGLLWLHDGGEKNEAPIAMEKHQTSDADTQGMQYSVKQSLDDFNKDPYDAAWLDDEMWKFKVLPSIRITISIIGVDVLL